MKRQGLATALEGAFESDDETARLWVSEARRLEVQLDEALEVGGRLLHYAITSPESSLARDNDIRHWRELVQAASA